MMLLPRKLAITQGKETKFLFVQDVLYCSSDSNYSIMFLTNEKPIHIHKSLKDITTVLPENLFFRIHHRYIINVSFAVKFIESDKDFVIMTDGTELPVSRRRKNDFLNMFLRL